MTKEKFISNLFNFLGCSPDCPNTKSKDDLYLISCNYHGLYEDDFCEFDYMNAKTGEITHNSWSTSYAAPHFNSFLRMSVPDAVEAGYISKEMYDKYCNDEWRAYLNGFIINTTYNISNLYNEMRTQLQIPCTIRTISRKYKGSCTFIELYEVTDSYTGQRSRQAKIVGLDGKIYTVKPSHVDADDVLKELREKWMSMIDTITDTKELTCMVPLCNFCLDDCVDVEFEKKQAKYDMFMNSKLPALKEWCRSKEPTKTDEEIEEWAIKIFKRKYPMK